MHYAKILIQMGGYIGQINMAISDLEKQPLIIGHDYLKKYNPDINGHKEFIKFNDDYITEEDNKKFSMNGLFMGEGTIYYFNLMMYLQAQETKANAITVEEFTKALVGAKKATLPEQYKDYLNVFSKEGFGSLPEKWPWNHTIGLKDGFQPVDCKVYPLMGAEQKQLADFIDKNLESKHICPSLSPIASPIFFIKKKDGLLWLVQDYCNLNEWTVKNWYSLLLI